MSSLLGVWKGPATKSGHVDSVHLVREHGQLVVETSIMMDVASGIGKFVAPRHDPDTRENRKQLLEFLEPMSYEIERFYKSVYGHSTQLFMGALDIRKSITVPPGMDTEQFVLNESRVIAEMVRAASYEALWVYLGRPCMDVKRLTWNYPYPPEE